MCDSLNVRFRPTAVPAACRQSPYNVCVTVLTYVSDPQPDPLPVDCLGLPHWGVIALLNSTTSHRLNYVDFVCGGRAAEGQFSTDETTSAALYAASNVLTIRYLSSSLTVSVTAVKRLQCCDTVNVIFVK